MSKKLVFRILGALASALIIVSVFVPYVSILGYTESLWNNYQTINSLYLPIMIVVFGVIGVIFFSLNIKTEFAYMSTGAIVFFLVMQTISFIEQKAFSTLSLGYYFLAVGALLTGVMAFLCNLKTKVKIEPVQSVEINSQTNMLEQIDKLYNDQQNPGGVQTIQPIEIQPIQNIEPVQPIQSVEPVQVQQSNQISEQLNNQVVSAPQTVVAPIEQQVAPVQQPVSPVVQEFTQAVVQQPVNSVPAQPQPVPQQPVNPVVQEFMNPSSAPVNPVVQEFMNPSSAPVNPTMPNTNNGGVDIFGQPINK